MGQYLVEIKSGMKVFVDTKALQSDLTEPKKDNRSRKCSVDEEQMLDVAEMCFIRISDQLIKHQVTVKECFSKYA
jgi:hypothetical protein